MSDSNIEVRSEDYTACVKYLKDNQNDSALDMAAKIIETEPEAADGYLFKARALTKMGRFQEAEATLLQAIRIADNNDLMLRDIETFIKLKYELASIRKEILKSIDVINVTDVVKRHLNSFETSILELHLFSGSSKSSSPPISSSASDSVIVKSEFEVKPNVVPLIDLESDQKSDSHETYNSDEEYDSCRTPLYNSSFGSEDIDERMITISRTEYYRLKESDKRCLELEENVQSLEKELRTLYLKLIDLTSAKKGAEKEASKLRSELDRMANTVRYVEDREQEYEDRHYFGIHPKNPLQKSTTNENKTEVKDNPKMIPISKVDINADIKTEIKSEKLPPGLINVRHIFHNNKGVPKVDQ